MRIGGVIVVALWLSACAVTRPVEGQFQDSREKFVGLATDQLNGSGTMEIHSTKGATCRGAFVYFSRQGGKGVFTCDDGRSGPFEFVSAGNSGSGTGDLGGDKFTFSFGGRPRRSSAAENLTPF